MFYHRGDTEAYLGKHQHATVYEAIACDSALEDHLREEAHAEMLAEQRAERYFEEGSDSFQARLFKEQQEEDMRLGVQPS